MSEKPQPFFSIGVTTYDRLDLLKEALSSIVSQTFPDFEIIVGNDNPHQMLSPEILNINDERISFVNRPTNLGELPNMNDLLARSRAQYFTWLADDDMYRPGFLEATYHALHQHDFPLVVYTSYISGKAYIEREPSIITSSRILTGREFLHGYLSRALKVIGCCGLFNKDYLKNIGGMEKLGNGFSPYSDNLVAIHAGLLDRLIYIDEPLIFFRTHENSISYTSPNIDVYSSAQADLLAKSLAVFKSNPLSGDFQEYLFLLLEWCVRDFDSVIRRSGSVSKKQIQTYLHFVQGYVAQLKGSVFYRRAWMLLIRIALFLIRDMGRRRIRLQMTSAT